MAKIEAGLLYSESHEWVRVEGDEAYIGISDFAQEELGDISYVDMPEIDDEIEKGETFNYYNDMVPSQIKLMKALGKERMDICAAFDVHIPDATEAFAHEYGYEGDDLYELLKNAECYKGILGPKSLQVRYFLEDIPFSLRSVQVLGKIAKVPTPVIDSVCTLGTVLVGEVMAEGYTMEALGLPEDISYDDFIKLCYC